MMLRSAVFGCVLTVLCSQANAATIGPNEILRITFSVDPSQFTELPDIVFIRFDSPFGGIVGDEATLFDEGEAVATNALAVVNLFGFRSPFSLFAGSMVTVDLSSILDGTSEARIDYWSPGGAVAFESAFVGLGRGRADFRFGNVPGISGQSVEIVSVPEPPITTIVGFAVVLALSRVLRRS